MWSAAALLLRPLESAARPARHSGPTIRAQNDILTKTKQIALTNGSRKELTNSMLLPRSVHGMLCDQIGRFIGVWATF